MHTYSFISQLPIRTVVAFLILLMLRPIFPAMAQIDFDNAGRGVAHVNVKVGGYLSIHGGYGISVGVGTWTEFRHFQPSFNLSVNLVGGRNNLGNRNRYLTNWQVNSVLSPMLTVGWQQGLYQEINPFYFGSIGAVYAGYRHSFTLGTNFVVMPRGLDRNLTTYRNRTQQLVYIGLRSGTKDWDVNLNLYEDYFMTDNGALQGLADNFDRFYTGGVNAQFRTRYVQAKIYADIYTGNSSRDLFDSPDLYMPYKSAFSKKPDNYTTKKHTNKRRIRRYVALDPGQKLFNVGRTFGVLAVSPTAFGMANPLNMSVQAFWGYQGGHRQMGLQNAIHSFISIQKVNPRFDPDSLHTTKRVKERLHYFYPAYQKGRPIGGIGYILNTIPGQNR